jgi:uncharacterized membrane protein
VSLYEFLIIVHIVAAAIWIGGGAMFSVIAARAWAVREDAHVIELSHIGDFVGNRVFAPATLLLIISGTWAVTEGPWEFSQTWISIGFTTWILGLLIAIFWHRTEGARIREAVARGGASSPEARRVAAGSLLVGLLELAILVVAVWAMVAKPGL